MRCKEKNNVPHGINNTNMPKKTIETTRVYLVKSKEKKEKISSEASPLGGGGGEGDLGGSSIYAVIPFVCKLSITKTVGSKYLRPHLQLLKQKVSR